MSDHRSTGPVCLAVGGSDSCGGAGIQADLRMFAKAGVHGCSVITALTAQNPEQVVRVEPVTLAQLDAEMHALFDYYEIAAVKTGMLVDAEHVAVLSALLGQLHRGAVVIDPVMVASSGRRLLDQGGVDALVHALFPLATLITPNLDEAVVLLGETVGDAAAAARALAAKYDVPVLLKGGHGQGEELEDWLAYPDGDAKVFRHARRSWGRDQAHGTGCRLAALITAHLAHGRELEEAIKSAHHELFL